MTTPLAALLRDKIISEGPMTVEDYVSNCLYHPDHGYYTNGHNFLPTGGTPYPHDFTTAPELTPLFGYTLANWVARTYREIGSPCPFILMECGPGRGSLMHSMLTHLQSVHPEVYAAAQPYLIETSPALTHLQQQTLLQFSQCQWASSPQTIPSQNPVILIANELLDAFPHTQIIEHEGRLQPRTISLNEAGELAFTQQGRITEISPPMRLWLQQLSQNLKAALFLDYGAATDQPTGDTLQAIHRHQKVSVFHQPGETDLTHHVNFANVTAAMADSHPHLQPLPLEHLSPFLMANGFASLALAEAQHTNMDTLLHRLLHPTQMGTLFKAQGFLQPCSTHTHP